MSFKRKRAHVDTYPPNKLEQNQIEGIPDRRNRPLGPCRSVYLGNLVVPQTSYYDICKIANEFGNIEFVKIVHEKHCAFLNFVEQSSAEAFYHKSVNEPFICWGKPISVGWARAVEMKPEIKAAIANGATRVLYVAGLPPGGLITEEILAENFCQFGEIENVVIKPGKNIAFVNMTSVKTAIRACKLAQTTGIFLGEWALKVNYGKEGIITRDPRIRVEELYGPMANVSPANFASYADLRLLKPVVESSVYGTPLIHGQIPDFAYHPSMQMSHHQSQFLPQTQNNIHLATALGNRGVNSSRALFLGNITEVVEYTHLCRFANRFGPIEWVKINRDKGSAFLNFTTTESAMQMFAHCIQRPFEVNGQAIKIGWAKSSPMRSELVVQIQSGATRNLFLGNLPDTVTEQQLRSLIGPFCQDEFDQIKIMAEKKIAFVNLTSIKSAVWAKTTLNKEPAEIDGFQIKVNYAKEMSNSFVSKRRRQQHQVPSSSSHHSVLLSQSHHQQQQQLYHHHHHHHHHHHQQQQQHHHQQQHHQQQHHQQQHHQQQHHQQQHHHQQQQQQQQHQHQQNQHHPDHNHQHHAHHDQHHNPQFLHHHLSHSSHSRQPTMIT